MKKIFLATAVVLGGACNKGPDTPASAPPACLIGLPSKVQETCACGPAQREIEVALVQTSLNELARASVLRCLNGELSVDFLTKSIVSGKVDGCVRQVQELEPAVRDEVIAIVSNAVATSSSPRVVEEQRIWLGCYARLVAPPSHRETLAEQNARADIEIRSSHSPLNVPQDPRQRWLYDLNVWVAGIDAMLPDLQEIYYSFDHQSFEGSISHSSKVDSSFKLNYRGWGCVKKMTATLVFKDGSRLAKSFDQCSALERESPAQVPIKGGAFAREGNTGPETPPAKCPPGTPPPRPMLQQPTCVP